MASAKSRQRPSPAAPGAERLARVTQVAFVLALAMVLARATMSEMLRDPMSTAVGIRMPGPATSIGIDLLLCVPALLVLGRRVADPAYALRWSWSLPVMGAAGAWAALSVAWSADKFAAAVGAANLVGSMALLWAMVQLVRSWLRLRIVAGAAAAVVGHGLAHN